jgi:tRNA nucleotidyltransferase (CCA-adding enzyme)
MFLRELFVTPKKILLEGGNIWPESEHFDQAIANHLAHETNKYLKGVHSTVHLIGSAATPTPGKMSGDLDVMVDLNLLMQQFGTKDGKTTRAELEKYLQGQGLPTKKLV